MVNANQIIRCNLLAIFIVCSALISVSQTRGTLTVSAATSDAGGNYKPRHILAIWIENDSSKFVKTLLVNANRRIQYLYTWKAVTTAAGSQYNNVDALTGATLNSHGTRTCSWNGTDILGTVVQDGKYTVHMELTDKHAQGNHSSFEFVKGPDSQTLTPTNQPGFSNIKIEWNPVATSSPNIPEEEILVLPNPVSNIFRINLSDKFTVEILDINGKTVKSTDNNYINISDLNNGIYFVRIHTGNKTITKKIVKNRND